MKILITGCAGYLGSKLSTLLLQKMPDVEIVGIDNLMYGQQSIGHLSTYENFLFQNLDIRNDKFLKILKTGNFDAVYPLAGLVGMRSCDLVEKNSWEINYQQIKNIVDWKLQTNSDIKIIFPNTNSGYGIGDSDYCTEESPLRPVSVYGEVKVAAEKYLIEHCPDATSFRLATVFGPSYRFRQEIMTNDFVSKAYFLGYMVIFEPHFRRNHVSVDDVVRAFCWALENKTTTKGVYNLGLTSANCTKKELALKIKKQLPKLVIVEDNFTNDPDKRDYIVSNEKLEKAGFIPQTTLETGIKQLIRFYKTLPRKQFTNA